MAGGGSTFAYDMGAVMKGPVPSTSTVHGGGRRKASAVKRAKGAEGRLLVFMSARKSQQRAVLRGIVKLALIVLGLGFFLSLLRTLFFGRKEARCVVSCLMPWEKQRVLFFLTTVFLCVLLRCRRTTQLL